MSKYNHIFFDLDHTLWDFKTNSRKMLETLFHEFDLARYGVENHATFIETYEQINESFWADYRKGLVDKQTLRNERFPRTLTTWEIGDRDLAHALNEEYLKRSPQQSTLFPNALETLDYLLTKYDVHLITNGFKEVQTTKLRSSKLDGYFKTITTSEDVGVLKPHPKVFHTALNDANAEIHDSIYVGDHFESDVLGSKNVGMDQVFFNPEGAIHPPEATYEIKDLKELQDLF